MRAAQAASTVAPTASRNAAEDPRNGHDGSDRPAPGAGAGANKDERTVLFVVDVELGDGEKGEVVVHTGETIADVARNVCANYPNGNYTEIQAQLLNNPYVMDLIAKAQAQHTRPAAAAASLATATSTATATATTTTASDVSIAAAAHAHAHAQAQAQAQAMAFAQARAAYAQQFGMPGMVGVGGYPVVAVPTAGGTAAMIAAQGYTPVFDPITGATTYVANVGVGAPMPMAYYGGEDPTGAAGVYGAMASVDGAYATVDAAAYTAGSAPPSSIATATAGLVAVGPYAAVPDVGVAAAAPVSAVADVGTPAGVESKGPEEGEPKIVSAAAVHGAADDGGYTFKTSHVRPPASKVSDQRNPTAVAARKSH